MRTFSMLVMALLLVFSASSAIAQDTQQQNEAAQDTEPIIAGDVNSESLAVVRNYLQTLDTELLAEDVTYTGERAFGTVQGRDFVTQTPTFFYGDAFSDRQVDVMSYIVADNTVAAELNFIGMNTGAYATLPATGMAVNVPMVMIFRVDNGQIISIRQYFDAEALYSQLGYPAYTGVAPLPGEINQPNNVDDIVHNSEFYYGQEVTVQGAYGEPVGQNAFTFWDQDLIDLGQEGVLVISRTGEGFDFPAVADATLQVTGVVQPYNRADLENEVGYALDDPAFQDYEEFTVLIADEVTVVDEVETIPDVEANAEAFYGQTVTLEGSVGDPVGEQAFVLFEDQLIGVGGRVLVVQPDLDAATFDAEAVRVTGTVQPLDVETLQNESGVTLDPNLLAEYQDLPVLIADDISLIR